MKIRKTETTKVETDFEAEAYAEALIANDIPKAISMVQKDIDGGTAVQDVVLLGLIPAFTIVGEKIQNCQTYIPEMMIATRAMSATLDHFKQRLLGQGEAKR
jgi:methanogenic corrinoid protein MtbC1